MRMIPSQPLGASSNAERRMFDQLRAAFVRPDRTGWFAMHSLNLPRHEYKRFGEIDFVICGPDGMDEGQDILNMDALAQLDSCLYGGISEGRWCFFHDANNQSGLCGSYVPDAYDYLESICPARIPLKTNCRNSLPILQRIQGDLDADMGNSGVGDGPAVREVRVADADSAIQALEKELNDLVGGEGFNAGDIVVLSPLPFAQSRASSLCENLRDSISVLDNASPRNMNRHAIGFAKIGDFKGLESEVVVLVDMPRPGHSEPLLPLHYVGMSRARALLSMICY